MHRIAVDWNLVKVAAFVAASVLGIAYLAARSAQERRRARRRAVVPHPVIPMGDAGAIEEFRRGVHEYHMRYEARLARERMERIERQDLLALEAEWRADGEIVLTARKRGSVTA